MASTAPFSLFTEFDIFLFKQGTHYQLYDKLGAKVVEHQGKKGTYFAVWAPNADYVSVIGNFNHWDKVASPLKVRQDESGIWEGFIENVTVGEIYKYYIVNESQNVFLEKADPFAKFSETPPKTASVVWDISYTWNDRSWIQNRAKKNKYESPLSIYELHMGSWKRNLKEQGRSLTYKEAALELTSYIKNMRFTHVEIMPLTEHPYDPSWGYQTLGYFSPTSRYGTPQELMLLIDTLHQNDIGIILDWVPSHFPTDSHGLGKFDGTSLFEHSDSRQGFHPDWTSYIFNYNRYEVRSFLISSARFWIEQYHADGIRVDGVSSMLYLDYSRKEGEWIPNKYNSNESLEAISFLKTLNTELYQSFPGIITVAEESTAWKGVSSPIDSGGLGFGFKWMMGWMNDSLTYFQKDPIYRKHHQNDITFSMIYYYHENFILPLSHDEVSHGKKSLIEKMPGDYWQKFANLRTLLSYMYFHPGGKLLFMGGEIGQFNEWDHSKSVEWNLLDYESHQGIQKLVKELNQIYREEPSLHELCYDPSGFEWIDIGDFEHSVISFIRKGKKESILVIINFTPMIHYHYRIGVHHQGIYQEIFNSDSSRYWGSNVKNKKSISSETIQSHGRDNSIAITIPPLSVCAFKLV